MNGQEFIALNGGPHFKFNEAISFVVNCRTQAEVDYFWKKLSAGGKEVQCGWLKDKFGLSWQIVPTILGELLSGKDAAKAQSRHAGPAQNGQTRHQEAKASRERKMKTRLT